MDLCAVVARLRMTSGQHTRKRRADRSNIRRAIRRVGQPPSDFASPAVLEDDRRPRSRRHAAADRSDNAVLVYGLSQHTRHVERRMVARFASDHDDRNVPCMACAAISWRTTAPLMMGRPRSNSRRLEDCDLSRATRRDRRSLRSREIRRAQTQSAACGVDRNRRPR